MVFTISLKQEQYLTYILSDKSAQSRLEVVPERGGLITQWNVLGQPILYFDAERFANPELSVRGGIPILFPICGNLPNDTYTYKGRQYTLKQHGFARNLPWKVVDKNTEEAASLTLALESNAQTRAVYPFDFLLTYTYQLKGNILTIEQRYANHSKEPMPFSSGLHPYFWAGEKEQLRFDIPASVALNQLTKETFPFSGSFDFSQDEIDLALYPLAKFSAAVTDSKRRLSITISYSDLYSNLVFWTVSGKNYYCLEPWTARRNALNTGEELIHLDPGATCETSVQIQVI